MWPKNRPPGNSSEDYAEMYNSSAMYREYSLLAIQPPANSLKRSLDNLRVVGSTIHTDVVAREDCFFSFICLLTFFIFNYKKYVTNQIKLRDDDSFRLLRGISCAQKKNLNSTRQH